MKRHSCGRAGTERYTARRAEDPYDGEEDWGDRNGEPSEGDWSCMLMVGAIVAALLVLTVEILVLVWAVG